MWSSQGQRLPPIDTASGGQGGGGMPSSASQPGLAWASNTPGAASLGLSTPSTMGGTGGGVFGSGQLVPVRLAPGVEPPTPVFRNGKHGGGFPAAPSSYGGALVPMGRPGVTAGTLGSSLGPIEPEDPQRVFRAAMAGLRDPVTARSDGSDEDLDPFGLPRELGLRRGVSAGSGAAAVVSLMGRGRSARASAGAESRHEGGRGAGEPLQYCCERFDASCVGARLATRLCFSCRRLEPTRPRSGFYCEDCFLRRHPWTRMAHNWVAYAQKEPPKPKRRADRPDRQAKAALRLLEQTREAGERLDDVTTSTFSERRAAARHCDGLMERVLGLVSSIRDDGRRRRVHAARVIQGLWRAGRARRLVEVACRVMWSRTLDAASGREYYINRRTGETQWEVPRTFFGREVRGIGLYPRKLAEDLDEEEAAAMIQGMFRSRRAREAVRRMVDGVWRVLAEEGTGRKYYFNVLSLETRWTRPALMGPEDGDGARGMRRGDPGAKAAARNRRRAEQAAGAAGRGRRLSVALPAGDDAPTMAELLAASGLGSPTPDEDRRPARPHDAATRAQAFWRGCIARWRCRARLAAVLRKLWDPDYGCYYYFNSLTGESSWEKPRLLGPEDIPAETAEGHVRTGRRAEDMGEEEAARRLQSVVRRGIAARRLRELARSVWAKVHDQAAGVGYYFNKLTGHSQWEMPFALAGQDLPTERADTPVAAASGLRSARPAGNPSSAALSARLESARLPASARQRLNPQPGASPTARGLGAPSARARLNSARASARFVFPSARAGEARSPTSAQRAERAAARRAPVPAARAAELASLPGAAAAASAVQGAARVLLARLQLLRRLSHAVERHVDPDYGVPFYFDKRTGESGWDKPRLLRGSRFDVLSQEQLRAAEARRGGRAVPVLAADPDDVAVATARLRQDSAAPAWLPSGVRPGRHAADLRPPGAATRIQAAWRMRVGRGVAVARCRVVFEKSVDPNYDAVFYYNTVSGESQWEKPRVLRGATLDVTAPETSRAVSAGVTPRGEPSARGGSPGRGGGTARRPLIALTEAAVEEDEEDEAAAAEGAAAVRIQAAARRFRAMALARRRCRAVFERLVDGDSGQVFWYSTSDGESRWGTPRVVGRLFGGGAAFEASVRAAQAAAAAGRTGIRPGRRAEEMEPASAAVAVQCATRAMLARRAARRRALAVTLRLWSDDWACHYYLNETTGEAAWLRPAALREEDDESLRTKPRDGAAGGTGGGEGAEAAAASARAAVSALGGPPDPSMLSARQSARLPMSVRTARTARGRQAPASSRGGARGAGRGGGEATSAAVGGAAGGGSAGAAGDGGWDEGADAGSGGESRAAVPPARAATTGHEEAEARAEEAEAKEDEAETKEEDAGRGATPRRADSGLAAPGRGEDGGGGGGGGGGHGRSGGGDEDGSGEAPSAAPSPRPPAPAPSPRSNAASAGGRTPRADFPEAPDAGRLPRPAPASSAWRPARGITQAGLEDLHCGHMARCVRQGRGLQRRAAGRDDTDDVEADVVARALVDSAGIPDAWAELERLYPTVAPGHLDAALREESIVAASAGPGPAAPASSLVSDATHQGTAGGLTAAGARVGPVRDTKGLSAAEAALAGMGDDELFDGASQAARDGGRTAGASSDTGAGGQEGRSEGPADGDRGFDAPDAEAAGKDAVAEARQFFASVPRRFGASRVAGGHA